MEVLIYRYEEEEPRCGLIPDPMGEDDGGRLYELPEGYAAAEGGDGLQIVGEAPCYLQMHHGEPLLVDENKKLAFLLEHSKRIMRRREALGMTRQELADSIGASLMELYQWETGEREPGTAALGRIAKALSCETLELTSL